MDYIFNQLEEHYNPWSNEIAVASQCKNLKQRLSNLPDFITRVCLVIYQMSFKYNECNVYERLIQGAIILGVTSKKYTQSVVLYNKAGQSNAVFLLAPTWVTNMSIPVDKTTMYSLTHHISLSTNKSAQCHCKTYDQIKDTFSSRPTPLHVGSSKTHSEGERYVPKEQTIDP